MPTHAGNPPHPGGPATPGTTIVATTVDGLTIVKRVADAHGWDVTLTESDGGGARFEFS